MKSKNLKATKSQLKKALKSLEPIMKIWGAWKTINIQSDVVIGSGKYSIITQQNKITGEIRTIKEWNDIAYPKKKD